jgi:MFS family permease
MSDPAIDRESEPGGRPTQADLRADYDDNFGRVRTPRQILRRRLLIPAIDFIVLGGCGLGASMMAAAAVVAEVANALDAELDELVEPLGAAVLALPLCGIGIGLSVLAMVAGVRMTQLQNHRLALITAYVVTCFSVASVFAIPFFPFGIWALVLLNKTEVRAEFDRPFDPTEFVRRRQPRELPTISPPALMVIGGIGLTSMTAALVVVIRDYCTEAEWEDAEFIWFVAIVLVGMAVFTGLFVRGHIRRRRTRNADLVASNTPSPSDHRDPDGVHA